MNISALIRFLNIGFTHSDSSPQCFDAPRGTLQRREGVRRFEEGVQKEVSGIEDPGIDRSWLSLCDTSLLRTRHFPIDDLILSLNSAGGQSHKVSDYIEWIYILSKLTTNCRAFAAENQARPHELASALPPMLLTGRRESRTCAAAVAFRPRIPREMSQGEMPMLRKAMGRRASWTRCGSAYWSS